jgi:GTPase SAR1 family protein
VLPSDRRRRGDRNIEAKIILLGDSGVGKSSIALRYCQDRFDEIQDATIGAAYLLKQVTVTPVDNPKADPT